MSFLLRNLIPVFVLGFGLCLSAQDSKTESSSVPNVSGLGLLKMEIKNDGGKLVPCRIHLRNEKGKVVTTQKYPFWNDHFVCDGQAELELAPGLYSWEIEKGPEFERKKGQVTINAEKSRLVAVEMRRIANLFKVNWVGGDMHVHRGLQDIELLMKAEDLHFAPVISWWNRPAKNVKPATKTVFTFDRSRRYTKLAGEDEREGGALLFYGLDRPLDLTVKSREYPSPMTFVRQAIEINPQVWIDIEKPFWWDVPVWLASGKMKSVGIANNHMCRSQMLANEAWGKPRDVQKLPNPRGNGFWSQQIYYQILNSGFRLPPSAGSASGVLPNPMGYNRVYVYCDQGFDRDKWFEGLKQGHSFVTNGPLLIASANQKVPGNVFQLPDGESTKTETLKIKFEIELTSLDPVPKLELVLNGKVVQEIKCSEARMQKLAFDLEVNEPGWFLVRAIADVKETFRFASTAPWYIESSNSKNPVSRKSARFFLNWTEERIERVRKSVSNKTERQEVLKYHLQALDFWKKKFDEATRD